MPHPENKQVHIIRRSRGLAWDLLHKKDKYAHYPESQEAGFSSPNSVLAIVYLWH